MVSETQPISIRVGADVGGTFTDVLAIDSRGRIWSHKIPSTPPAFESAVLDAVRHMLEMTCCPCQAVTEVAHGTTVATNAILEQRGARTALITSKGFRDVLALRRIRAPLLYDLFFDKPKELVERYLRMEINERMSATGEVLTPIDVSDLWPLKERLEREAVESVAVCFLHANQYPDHENQVGEFFRTQMPRLNISLSSAVVRERGEYERTATTVVNAYLRPVMERYLRALHDGLRSMAVEAPLMIMQSAGGLTRAADAAMSPVFVLESGPAAGVLAARHRAKLLGIANVITLDIGGTTAKAALIEDGQVSYSANYEVGASVSAGNRLQGGGGDVILAPSIDIAEVGAGGGSVAYLDRAGGLRVGPRSAGAMPGPACYQRGGREPTVTDANVVLGFIRTGELAAGGVRVDRDAAARAIYDAIAVPLGMDLLTAADGIHRIANASTLRALRAVSTERGRDCRDFSLMAFGGAGPIHAAALGRELHCPQVIVPPLPGLFSALGLLLSGIEHHDVRSCYLHGNSLRADTLQRICDEVEQSLLDHYRRDSLGSADVTLRFTVDVRYRGQASLINIPLVGPAGPGQARIAETTVERLCNAFETEHERLYGHRSDPENPVQVVAVRIVGQWGTVGREEQLQTVDRLVSTQGSRLAYFGSTNGGIETPVVSRSALSGTINGPLLIDEYDSTTVVPPDMRVRRDAHENIIMELRDD